MAASCDSGRAAAVFLQSCCCRAWVKHSSSKDVCFMPSSSSASPPGGGRKGAAEQGGGGGRLEELEPPEPSWNLKPPICFVPSPAVLLLLLMAAWLLFSCRLSTAGPALLGRASRHGGEPCRRAGGEEEGGDARLVSSSPTAEPASLLSEGRAEGRSETPRREEFTPPGLEINWETPACDNRVSVSPNKDESFLTLVFVSFSAVPLDVSEDVLLLLPLLLFLLDALELKLLLQDDILPTRLSKSKNFN
ncbi:hypothetical protein EYF80_049584 [Liparis tanakae]|uniref:Uncharacterized protein n=1 Tax=Liparis tanakae TaxID=230148 RepID=A0A4Z2FHJ3_9TELE|nr:hypothetical protein EYF80_049584 [Liparis tanakae]